MNNTNTGNRILSVCKREIVRIAANKPIWVMTIILPILTFLLIAFIYQKGTLRDIPVVIYDGDNSEVSRLIARSLDASPAVKIVKRVGSVDEVKKEMQKGNVYGGLYIPNGFENSLKGGNRTTIVFYKYSYNLMIGTNLLKESSTIIKTISGGVLLKKLRSKGMPADQAMSIINPVAIETQSLFNPSYNYEEYLVPGVIPFLLQMIIMLAALSIIGSEFTENTLDDLLNITSNPVEIIIGKSIPHLAIHFATALAVIGILFPVFSIHITGSVIWTLLFFFYFIAASFFVGIFISALIHKEMFATEVILFVNTPAFIFSGYTFPMWSMPAVQVTFAQIIPYTHFLTGFLKIYQMGAPISYAAPEFFRLSVFLFGSLLLSVFALKIQISKYRIAKFEAGT